MSHDEFKQKVENLSRFLTYPELDDLHAIEDYVNELEVSAERAQVGS